MLAAVTVLIDEPRWWFRGRRWSHLVSDETLDELHQFADSVGIPRRGFQGDHYDIPEEYLAAMLAGGAVMVTSRDLLRRLRAAGLRLGPHERRAWKAEYAGR
ncbi:DUF4031 domain-containing protein [soil metagenome]